MNHKSELGQDMAEWREDFRKRKDARVKTNLTRLAEFTTPLGVATEEINPNTWLLTKTGKASVIYYPASHTWRMQKGNSRAKRMENFDIFFTKYFL